MPRFEAILNIGAVRCIRQEHVVLQQHMTGTSASVVAAHGSGLVEATPARPVQHHVRWGEDAHDQAVDEPTDLGNGERDQAVVGGQLRHQRPPLSALPGSWERTTARYASASIASVMWRYQPWEWRTS